MNRYALIIGIALIVCFIIFAVNETVSSQAVYVTNVSKLEEVGNKSVQFIGTIDHSKTLYDYKTDTMCFMLRDDKNNSVKVIYSGVKPGNFDGAKSAVVQGQYKNGVFHADQVLLKCPSKYENQ